MREANPLVQNAHLDILNKTYGCAIIRCASHTRQPAKHFAQRQAEILDDSPVQSYTRCNWPADGRRARLRWSASARSFEIVRPQRLDLARRTRRCNSRIQFVELELPGVKIGRHRVRPPY